MQDGRKAVWSISYVSVAFFPSLKHNFIAYRSSKVSDCIFEIHKLWQSGFSRVYFNSYWSCLFEPEIIKVGQTSHKMYNNNIVNFHESTTILHARMKKSLETYHILLVYIYIYIYMCVCVCVCVCIYIYIISVYSYSLSMYISLFLSLSHTHTDAHMHVNAHTCIHFKYLPSIELMSPISCHQSYRFSSACTHRVLLECRICKRQTGFVARVSRTTWR